MLHVNPSTYYKFRNRKPSKRELDNQYYRKIIFNIYTASKKRLGAGKIKIILYRDYGINISEGRVYRLMKSMILPKMSTIKPKYPKNSATSSLHLKNALNQKFDVKLPNQVWTTDFTYIPIGSNKKKVYLCVIMDLFSRKIISWKVSEHINTRLAIDVLNEAVTIRNPQSSLLFHSDRGSQFTAKDFRDLLDKYNFLPSNSHPGYPYDNSVTESFFKYLKQRELNRKSFSSLEQVKLACFEYIESFYNNYNPHSANDGLTPNEKEDIFFKNSRSN